MTNDLFHKFKTERENLNLVDVNIVLNALEWKLNTHEDELPDIVKSLVIEVKNNLTKCKTERDLFDIIMSFSKLNDDNDDEKLVCFIYSICSVMMRINIIS